MKRLFYYICVSLLSWSCSASYWSAASFSGDDMYDTYDPTTKRYGKDSGAATTQEHYYTSYRRPDSYYQYQYVSEDSPEGDIVVEPKYVSSTYGVWDKTPVIETYVYIESTPYMGYYDPFYYNHWGYTNPYYNPYWGSPYYGWYPPIYVAPHPPRPHRPSYTRPKPNIVQRPSSSVAPSTSSGSSRRRTTTPTRVTRSSVGSPTSTRTSTTPTPTSTSTSTRGSMPSSTTTTNSSRSYR